MTCRPTAKNPRDAEPKPPFPIEASAATSPSLFTREGADILISYLSEDTDAEETAWVVREAGRQAVVVPGDISEEAHCRSLVEQAVSELRRLDILVNNEAYQMTREGIEQIPDGEWEHTFRTNIFAVYYLCKAAWPHMRPGSTIINTASIQAYQPSELVPIFVFLASDESSYITGEVVGVTGGKPLV
jgi:NAD(P)-dependent dehydrogenase (short-subunit alcohol dehydrogenase family)